jgi:cytochrome c551/c552
VAVSVAGMSLMGCSSALTVARVPYYRRDRGRKSKTGLPEAREVAPTPEVTSTTAADAGYPLDWRRPMRRKLPTVILLCLVAAPMLAQEAPVTSNDPQHVYDARGCATCHDQTKDQRTLGLGPSWHQISEAYKGHADDLSKFLKGEAKPRVESTGDPKTDEASNLRMHGQIVSLKTLSESERKALETFLMEHMIGK